MGALGANRRGGSVGCQLGRFRHGGLVGRQLGHFRCGGSIGWFFLVSLHLASHWTQTPTEGGSLLYDTVQYVTTFIGRCVAYTLRDVRRICMYITYVLGSPRRDQHLNPMGKHAEMASHWIEMQVAAGKRQQPGSGTKELPANLDVFKNHPSNEP